MATVFHNGEHALQARLGCPRAAGADRRPHDPRLHARPAPRVLRPAAVPDRRQPGRARRGPGPRSWSAGPASSSSPDPRTLDRRGAPPPSAIRSPTISRAGAPLGLLGIQPETRRRNRMNGTVTRHYRDGAFTVHVDQSFGNCPKYIQARAPRFVADPQTIARRATGPPGEPRSCPTAAQAMIAAADTFFIATAAANAAPAARRPRASTSRIAAAGPASCG